MKWIYFGEISVSLMRSREIKHINQKWMLAPARGIRARFVKPQKWTGFLPPSVLVTIIGYHSYHQCVINTLMQVPRGARRLQGWAKPILSKESSFLFLRGRIRHPPSQSKYSIRFHLLFIQFQNCLLKPVRLVPCRCRKVLPAPLYSQWRPFGLATPRFWLRIEDGAGKCYRRRIFGRSDLLQRPSSVPNLCFSWIPHPGHPLGVECFVASQGKVFNLDLQKCLWSKRFHRSLCSSTFQIATNAKGRGVLRLLLLQQQIKMLRYGSLPADFHCGISIHGVPSSDMSHLRSCVPDRHHQPLGQHPFCGNGEVHPILSVRILTVECLAQWIIFPDCFISLRIRWSHSWRKKHSSRALYGFILHFLE